MLGVIRVPNAFLFARQCGGVAALTKKGSVIRKTSDVYHITPTRMGSYLMCSRHSTLLIHLFAFVAEVINLILHQTW